MSSFKAYGNGGCRRRHSVRLWPDWMEIPIPGWLAIRPLSICNRRCLISFRVGSKAFGMRFKSIGSATMLPWSRAFELQLRSGEWVSVPHSPGQLIVNIGDMLQEATGGYLPSTSHRVATPDAEQPAVSRMSLPLFLHPRPDVVLSPRYTAGQYLMQRLDELGVA